MKKRITGMLFVLCAIVQGAWAQTWTEVTKENLVSSITNNAYIRLTEDIQLSNYLNIEGITVTIDLNGHTLSRNIPDYDHAGHVIWAHNGSTLTLTSSEDGGSIEGGMANNGGAIHIPHGNTVTATNVIFRNNSAADHAGAIWNNGTFTATSCTFTNNSAEDVGAIYNAVSNDGAGTATLTGCTFTGNVGKTGAGALANAVGNTVMTIDGCTITDNTAGSRGGAIWNGGTLNVKGKVIASGNTKAGNIASNVFLKSGKVITLTGALTDDSSIGVEMESTSGGTFTSGYNIYHDGIDPVSFFTADLSAIASLNYDINNEACLTVTNTVYFVERSWDETSNKVFSTMNTLTGSKIAYANEPNEGDYKEVTSDSEDWFGMGGYSTTVPEYYVVSGNVNRPAIVVQGKNVHLILCDGAVLRLTGGLKLEGENKLYIHSQSYGGNMGRLIVTNEYESAAGIGSAWDRVNGELIEKKAGELVIYGGHIEVTGGKYGAGIGSCQRRPHKHDDICNRVTVYGGYVEATGGESAAGIGGGAGYELAAVDAGTFTLYDGTVIAQGGNGAAGVGGGGGYASSGDYQGGWGGTVNIYGGELTATGGDYGAGIGSAGFAYTVPRNPVTKVNIYNGKVTANGGKNAAGIGSGDGNLPPGTDVCIYNGTVIANGGEHGAGIGGGDEGMGGTLKVLDGTVIATGGIGAAGIGGGYQGMCYFDGADEDKVYIAGGTVIAKAGEQGGGDNRAFGPGKNCNRSNGPLKIGDNMMVGAGNNGTVQKYFPANERKKACWYNSYAEVSPCTHSGSTYTMTDTQHTRQCNYCTANKAEDHTFVDSKCTVCNYETDKKLYANVYLPDLGSSEYRYKDAETYYMAPGSTFLLPSCNVIPPGYEFVGWVVGTRDLNGSYLPRYNLNEDPLPALSEYTLTENQTFTARYHELNVNLYNDDFNGETLYTYDGMTAKSVKLLDRGLIKDGNWNTLCLPFSLTETQLAASSLAGGDIRTLSSASFSDGTLTLNFTDKGAVKSITAGTPYIVKWENGETIVDPTFSDVTIDYTYHPVEAGVVTFSGNFNPVGCSAGDNTMLYLGSDNTLYYPSETMTINSFRAYFQLNGITAGTSSLGNIRSFVLNFSEETTGVTAPLHDREGQVSESSWFTLDGRRLSGKPTTRGVYIKNGKKIVIQ